MTDQTEPAAPRIGMPRALVDAIAEIKMKIEPATQTGEISEGEGDQQRHRSYATPDDIFGALQREMGERCMVCEMISLNRAVNEVNGMVLIEIDFAPRWYIGDIVYTADDSPIVMVSWLEGMNTAAAMRTLAEKTYLRNLFKIPTVKAGGAADSPESHARPVPPPSAAESAESPSGIKPLAIRRKNPLQLGKDDSEALRASMVAAFDACEAIPALEDAFKGWQEDFTRLQPKDSQFVRASYARREGEIRGNAA